MQMRPLLTPSGRKIRDRIAKLQERVIANELRAAATLNGWDQPYHQPLIGNRSTLQQDIGVHNGTADPSFSSPEPFSTFGSSYGLSMTSSWPSATARSTYMSEDPTWGWSIGASASDTAYANPSIWDFIGDGTNPPFLENSEEQSMRGISNAGGPNATGSHATLASQPLYYAVTGKSLGSFAGDLKWIAFLERLTSFPEPRNRLPPNSPSPEQRISAA